MAPVSLKPLQANCPHSGDFSQVENLNVQEECGDCKAHATSNRPLWQCDKCEARFCWQCKLIRCKHCLNYTYLNCDHCQKSQIGESIHWECNKCEGVLCYGCRQKYCDHIVSGPERDQQEDCFYCRRPKGDIMTSFFLCMHCSCWICVHCRQDRGITIVEL
jgi:hypothetical protein